MNNRLLFALPLGRGPRFPGHRADHLVVRSEPACRRGADSVHARLIPTRPAKRLWPPPSREGFWGRVNPFARKSYVKRQTEPIRDRVNELDELTSAEQQGD